MKFDPMTGEPIYENSSEEVLEKAKKASGKKSKIVIIAIVAVVLLAAVAIFGGLFQSKQMKILTAVVNTLMDESKLAKACSPFSLIGSDAFTLYVNADVEGQEVEATLSAKNRQMQLEGTVDISSMPEIQGIIGLDSKEVRAKIDGLDTVMVYKYTEDNDGDLIEQIDEETVEVINDVLLMLTSDKDQNTAFEKAAEAALKEFNEWEIEKVEKKSFEVDGKKRDCVGYRFEVDEDKMEDMSDVVLEAMKDKTTDDVLDTYEDLFSNAIDGMPDTEVTVYIYKDKLAAVLLEIGKEDVEIYFEGGAYRTQNVIIEADGYTVLELAGTTDGSVEEYELELAGRKVLSMEYDEKSGDLSLEENYTGLNICVDAVLDSKSNELSFVLEDFDMDYYSISCDLEINLKKGASLQKINGEEFDLGAADEDDLEDLIDDLEDVLY